MTVVVTGAAGCDFCDLSLEHLDIPSSPTLTMIYTYILHILNNFGLVKLVEDLQTGTLKGGDEDSAVVARVLENYLRPMQKTMLEVTPAVQVQLSGQKNKERSSLLPLLMKVHAV